MTPMVWPSTSTVMGLLMRGAPSPTWPVKLLVVASTGAICSSQSMRSYGVDVAGVDDEVDALEGGFDFGGWFGPHGGDVGVGDEADFHAGSFQAVVVSDQYPEGAS